MKKIFIAGLSTLIIVIPVVSCNNNTVKTETESEKTGIVVPEIKSAFVNGDSLHYTDIGKGDPIIFVHGTLGDYRVWGMQVDTFAKKHRVISYSRRYAYPNKQIINDSVDYSVAIHATDLAQFIKALNLGPVHLVGHSYGAYTTLLTTMQHPELVKTLTLGEPPVMPLLSNVPGGDTIFQNFISRALQPAGDSFKAGNDEKAVMVFMSGVIGDTTFYSHLPQDAKNNILQNTLELRGAVFTKNPFPQVTCDDLKKINTPVLLLTGEKTALLFSAINEQLNKCLPNKESMTITNATHGLQMENPADFNKIVLAFIDKH